MKFYIIINFVLRISFFKLLNIYYVYVYVFLYVNVSPIRFCNILYAILNNGNIFKIGNHLVLSRK